MQAHGRRREIFSSILSSYGIGLAYFLGSQKELGPRRLDGEEVAGAPDSDLDLGVVLLEHPLDYWEGQKLRQRLQETLAHRRWCSRGPAEVEAGFGRAGSWLSFRAGDGRGHRFGRGDGFAARDAGGC